MPLEVATGRPTEGTKCSGTDANSLAWCANCVWCRADVQFPASGTTHANTTGDSASIEVDRSVVNGVTRSSLLVFSASGLLRTVRSHLHINFYISLFLILLLLYNCSLTIAFWQLRLNEYVTLLLPLHLDRCHFGSVYKCSAYLLTYLLTYLLCLWSGVHTNTADRAMQWFYCTPRVWGISRSGFSNASHCEKALYNSYTGTRWQLSVLNATRMINHKCIVHSVVHNF